MEQSGKRKRRRGRKEGSIYQRGDGLWVAELDLGVIEGKRKRKQLYAKTRAEVLNKLKDCLVAQHQGIPLNFDRQSVGAYLDRWIKDAATPRLRPRTLVGYKQIIEAHLKPALGSIQVKELAAQHVQALIGTKVEAGLAPRTIRAIRAVLRSALSDAVKWRLVTYNAAKAASLPRPKRVQNQVFTPEQARAFVTAAEAHRLGSLFTVAAISGVAPGRSPGPAVGGR
jgi:integrase